MDDNLKEVIAEWKFNQSVTIELIKGFNDKIIQKKLPRPGINTFCKHFQEMIGVQEAYIRGIETGKMDFSIMPADDKLDGKDTCKQLMKKIESIEKRFNRVVNTAKVKQKIQWSKDDSKALIAHITTLCTHEVLHQGQIVAFCYALNIPIPKYVVEMWSLTQQ
jgi:hypothetical protein